MGLGPNPPSATKLLWTCCGTSSKSLNLAMPKDRKRAMAYKQELISLEGVPMYCLQVLYCLGIYFNLEISLLGGPCYYSALHKRMMGTGKLRAWLKVSQQMGFVPPEGQGVRLSTPIPQYRRGDTPAQGSNPDSSPGPQHKENTHTAFETAVE